MLAGTRVWIAISLALAACGARKQHCDSGFTVEHGWISGCWTPSKPEPPGPPTHLVVMRAVFQRADQARELVKFADGCELSERQLADAERSARDEHVVMRLAPLPPAASDAGMPAACVVPDTPPYAVVFSVRVPGPAPDAGP